MTETRLYYECHITIEPVMDPSDQDVLKAISSVRGFRIANLLMQKRKEDTPERSKYDTFLTGRGKTLEELQSRAFNLLMELKAAGFKVWRVKIEDTLLDTDYGDIL